MRISGSAAGLIFIAVMLVLFSTVVVISGRHIESAICPAKLQTAAISQRAAQICSTELVGCSLTFEQVKQVLAEQEAAKGCQ